MRKLTKVKYLKQDDGSIVSRRIANKRGNVYQVEIQYTGEFYTFIIKSVVNYEVVRRGKANTFGRLKVVIRKELLSLDVELDTYKPYKRKTNINKTNN